MKYDWKQVDDILVRSGEDVTKVVVDTAKQFYCGLYNLEPSWIVRDNLLISPFARGALKQFCGANNVPPPPPGSPFTGGQCEGVQYSLQYYSLTSSTGSDFGELIRELNGQVFTWATPILGRVATQTYTVAGQVITDFETFKAAGRQFTATGSLIYRDVNGNILLNINLSSSWGIEPIGFVRTDGQPDTCGDPPGGYPPAPPPSISQRSTIVSITNFDGGTTDIDVSVNADIDGTIKFPSVINVGGVNVGIDVAGLTIGEININRRSGGGGGGSDLVNPTSQPEPSDTEETEETEETEGLDEDCPGLVAITVTVTRRPGNASIISGRGAPNVELIGWVEFKREGKYFPRTFLSFVNSRIEAPEGADGYAITFRVGYAGKVRKIIELPKEEST